MTENPTPPPDAALFRQAMGRFVTGVTVLATRWQGQDYAMTASAVASVSIDPLLVLACVEVDARFHDAVLGAGHWGMSILPASARPIAEWLATRGRPVTGQLDPVPHRAGPALGVPLVDGALATFELVTDAVHPAGDHSIVVGRVVALDVPVQIPAAMTYYRGRLGSLE